MKWEATAPHSMTVRCKQGKEKTKVINRILVFILSFQNHSYMSSNNLRS